MKLSEYGSRADKTRIEVCDLLGVLREQLLQMSDTVDDIRKTFYNEEYEDEEVNHMAQDAEYLKMTIHNNDFSHELSLVAKLLYDAFKIFGWPFYIKGGLSSLKEPVTSLICKVHNVCRTLWIQAPDTGNWSIDPSRLTLEFVDYSDIPDWDNYESVYIPMFNDCEIIVR